MDEVQDIIRRVHEDDAQRAGWGHGWTALDPEAVPEVPPEFSDAAERYLEGFAEGVRAAQET
jgi:hypothetical protein